MSGCVLEMNKKRGSCLSVPLVRDFCIHYRRFAFLLVGA